MENTKRIPSKAIKKIISDFMVENLPEIIERVKKELNVELHKFESVKVNPHKIDLRFQNNPTKHPKECVYIEIYVNSSVGWTFLNQEDKDQYQILLDNSF